MAEERKFQVGDRVVIRQRGRFDEEVGVILNFAGSSDKPVANVLTCGWSPLIPLDQLELETEEVN